MEKWKRGDRIGQGTKLSKNVCSTEKGGSLVPQVSLKHQNSIHSCYKEGSGRREVLYSYPLIIGCWLHREEAGGGRGHSKQGSFPFRSRGQLLVNQNSQLLE